MGKGEEDTIWRGLLSYFLFGPGAITLQWLVNKTVIWPAVGNVLQPVSTDKPSKLPNQSTHQSFITTMYVDTAADAVAQNFLDCVDGTSSPL